MKVEQPDKSVAVEIPATQNTLAQPVEPPVAPAKEPEPITSSQLAQAQREFGRKDTSQLQDCVSYLLYVTSKNMETTKL